MINIFQFCGTIYTMCLFASMLKSFPQAEAITVPSFSKTWKQMTF